MIPAERSCTLSRALESVPGSSPLPVRGLPRFSLPARARDTELRDLRLSGRMGWRKPRRVKPESRFDNEGASCFYWILPAGGLPGVFREVEATAEFDIVLAIDVFDP